MLRNLIAVFVGFLVSVSAAAKPVIHVSPQSGPVEVDAARELQRFLFEATGEVYQIQRVQTVDPEAEGVVLGTASSLPDLSVAWPFNLDPPSHDGYIVRSLNRDGSLIVIASAVPRGVRNGVFGYLEQLGYTFDLTRHTTPEGKTTWSELAEPGLAISASPAFRLRGTLPMHNHLIGPLTWELADYEAYIDGLVRLRCNALVIRSTSALPFTGYELDGQRHQESPLPNSGTPAWNYTAMPTREFLGGTSAYFSDQEFGAAAAQFETPSDNIAAAKVTLREALAYARGRGLEAAIGFEVIGNPLDPAVQRNHSAQIAEVLRTYPMVTQLWLWQARGDAQAPGAQPEHRSQWDSYTLAHQTKLQSLGDPARRAEAARLALFAHHTRQLVHAINPDVTVTLSGFGGDAEYGFTEYMPALTRLLPEGVNLASVGPMPLRRELSDAYGGAGGGRWPILPLEYDGDLWMPQPVLKELAAACRDGYEKGIDGIFGLHWRQREINPALGFMAAFAWDTELTPESYLAARTERLYGENGMLEGEPVLQRLNKLGYRWVGGEGQSERYPFAWKTGFPADRAGLATVAYNLSARVGDRSLLDSIIPTDTLLEFIPTRIPILNVPTGLGVITGGIRGIRRPAVPAPLKTLYEETAYVLAMDYAASRVATGTADQLDATQWIRDSRLAEAMHLYAGLAETKSELAAIASMNLRAWADLRERAGLETVPGPLQDMPENVVDRARLRVLPDRVLLTNYAQAYPAEVELQWREAGSRTFNTVSLAQRGNASYAFAFPETIPAESLIEYGVVARAGRTDKLSWPEGFPDHTALYIKHALAPVPLNPPKAVRRDGLQVQHTYDRERQALLLSWDVLPGEKYVVLRDGEKLGEAYAGFFADTTVPVGETVRYTVEAHDLHTTNALRTVYKVEIPEGAPIRAPQRLALHNRGGRAVVRWDADEPAAADYRIRVYDNQRDAIAEAIRAAEFGHTMAFADEPREAGAYSFNVTPITANGVASETSPTSGIVLSRDPLWPLVQLSTDDPGFLDALAALANNSIVIGGAPETGVREFTDWNPANEVTFAMNVLLDDLEGRPVLLCQGPWGSPRAYLQLVNGRLRFFLQGIGRIDGGAIEAGRWHHIGATYSDGELRLYVDGDVVARRNVDEHPTERILAPAAPGMPDSVYLVRGQIDDITVFDVALAPEEMADLAAISAPDQAQ